MKAPTVEDVARVAGVSRQTVSNVINTPAIVREATRERVERAISDLGYRPHAAARSLRTRRSSTIGIHLDPYAGGISGVVLDRFVHALTERADDRGMRILLYAARSAQDEISRMSELLDGGEIDAVVLSGTFQGDPRTEWLSHRDVPFVAFGRPWAGDDETAQHRWVDVDGAAGTRQAAQHARDRAGRLVGFLGWPSGSGTGDDRERGWIESLGAARGPRLVAEDRVTAARAAAADALERHPHLSALVCASDTLAIGAHLAAIDAGHTGLVVYGFDNTPAAEAMELSSVEQRPEQVAAGALRLLMGESGSAVGDLPPETQRHIIIEPALVVRGAAAAP
ncbi:LacI family DNA-binding transcriptional regulator [Microbacterium schleiferi]|uniref:LacI family DNA-binding transcriptional regulator n=1 Tax=Microbacterium schleiferi TaxID=69362 RepID=A0A7S8RIQ9_9MICO|nr:LacI family DNA-binding transcriptional regulator [Microbacterium schleiferi]QPE05642.1 LacI family DNA-binding transcriptional regulator [Microbacterium schleiferi]